jgi:hypothetical protein
MTACDYCLSGCSDDGHSLDDEGCGPSRECFHVDLGDRDKGNHLGMPEDDDPPGPASRIDIPRELAVVPVPAGGQDTQLEQIREMQAKLDEEAGQLVKLRQNIKQEWAGRALAGEACHRARDIQRHIVDDARARLPPASSGVGQNLAAAAILLRAMPEPSTTEGATYARRTQESPGGCCGPTGRKLCLPKARVPLEHRATTSRLMREASVHTGHTRDGTPAAPGRLGDEPHHRNRRARLDERVRRGYHPRRGGRYDSEEDRSPTPKPPGPQAFSRAIRRAPFPARFRVPTTITKYSGETRLELWLVDYRLTCQLGGTDDDNLIIRNLPLFLSNFRWETLTFEVVEFRGTYHAMLGRPCYAKFMAVPNYMYLKLKMPGPNGVITVGSTYRHAYECDVECVEYAEALAESEALIADLECLSQEVPDAKRHAGNFEPAEEVKFVPLDPSNDACKQVWIGSELDPK